MELEVGPRILGGQRVWKLCLPTLGATQIPQHADTVGDGQHATPHPVWGPPNYPELVETWGGPACSSSVSGWERGLCTGSFPQGFGWIWWRWVGILSCDKNVSHTTLGPNFQGKFWSYGSMFQRAESLVFISAWRLF